jgi:hypothetical protein
MSEVEFVGLIRMPIYYVVEEEKTVLEAVLMGEACVLSLGFSDPGLEQYVRTCMSWWTRTIVTKGGGQRFLYWNLLSEC